jgi:hypothetical protein
MAASINESTNPPKPEKHLPNLRNHTTLNKLAKPTIQIVTRSPDKNPSSSRPPRCPHTQEGVSVGSVASDCLGGTPRASGRSADNASDFLSRERPLRCLAPDSLFRPRWSGAWVRIAGGAWMRERAMGARFPGFMLKRGMGAFRMLQ